MHIAGRILGALAIVVTVCWTAYVLVYGSDAGITVPSLLVLVWGGLAALALWAVFGLGHVLAARRAKRRSSLARLLTGPAAVLVCFVITWFGVSFRARFLLSKPALDAFARSLRAEASSRALPGARVGLFRAQEVQALPGGVVRIITTTCMFDDCGLAYSASGPPPRIGEDYYSPLGGNWWHWWRSW